MLCQNQPIDIIRGTSRTIALTLSTADGSPYILQPGEVLRFGVKTDPAATDYTIIKTLTDADADTVAGRYLIDILPSDTEDIGISQYYYDIGLQRADNDYTMIVPLNSFNVEANITRRG